MGQMFTREYFRSWVVVRKMTDLEADSHNAVLYFGRVTDANQQTLVSRCCLTTNYIVIGKRAVPLEICRQRSPDR